MKSENAEALGRGAFRVMGLCKTSLMLGIYSAATNLRLMRAWAMRCRDTSDLLPLDFVFTSEATTARTCRVLDDEAWQHSDHLPVLAEIVVE